MREPDLHPVVRFFNPLGAATWLATEIDEDGILFGLADLGFGCPELGSFALFELEGIRLAFGLGIERDLLFDAQHPLSIYAAAARAAGSIVLGEQRLRAAARALGAAHGSWRLRDGRQRAAAPELAGSPAAANDIAGLPAAATEFPTPPAARLGRKRGAGPF